MNKTLKSSYSENPSVDYSKVYIFLPTTDNDLYKFESEFDASIEYEITYSVDAFLQFTEIKNKINEDPSIFIIYPIDTLVLKELIDELKEHNHKVISYGKILNNSNIDYIVGFDYLNVAILEVNYIKNNINKENNILIIKSYEYKESEIADISYNELLNLGYNNLTILQVYTNIEEEIENYLQNIEDHPKAIISPTDEITVILVSILEKIGIEYPVITSFGYRDEIKELIIENKVSQTVDPNFKTLTIKTKELVESILNDEEIIEDDYIEIDRTLIKTLKTTPKSVDVGNIYDYTTKEDAKELDYIEVVEPPLKTEYFQYEIFDKTGMKVVAYFKDKSEKEVVDFDYFKEELDLSDNVITINVTINGITKTSDITIKVLNRTPKNLIIETKKQYLDLDILNKNDFKVIEEFDKGNNRIVRKDKYNILLNNTVVDDTDLTIGLYNLEFKLLDNTIKTTYQIEVLHKLIEIYIYELPKTLSYRNGERLEKDEMVIMAKYSDSKEIELPLGKIKVIPERIQFEDDNNTTLFLSYQENNIEKKTPLKVYKKLSIELDDTNIKQEISNSYGIVNLYTTKLKYYFIDYKEENNILPFELKHVYNQELDENYNLGSSFKFNLTEEIEIKDNKYKYLSTNGKTYTFSNGYTKGIRSDIRQDELGYDLYKENDIITLKDRNNNTLIFEYITNKYRLKELHKFPSTKENPIPIYSYNLEYNSNGQLVKMRFSLDKILYFNYQYNLLKEIVLKTNNVETTILKYSYSNNKLTNIEYLNDNINETYKRNIEIEYTTNTFKVIDKEKEDTNKNKLILEYTFDELYKVNKIKKGYSSIDFDTTTIKIKDNFRKIVNKEIISIYKFNDIGIESYYSYKLEKENNNKIEKIYNLESNGYSYLDCEAIYSDSKTLVTDDFKTLSGFSGGKLIENYGIINSIYGNNLSKNYEFDKTYSKIYISLFYKSNEKIKLEVYNNNKVIEQDILVFPTNFGFYTLAINNTKKITLKLTGKDIYLTLVKITTITYQIKKTKEKEYDEYGRVIKEYRYNPIENKTIEKDYTYDEYNLVESTTKINDEIISKEEYKYQDNLLISKKIYGKSIEYQLEEYNYSKDKTLNYCKDINNKEIYYLDTLNKTVINNDNNLEYIRFNNSNIIEKIKSNEYNNLFTYDTKGNIKSIRYGYNNISYKRLLEYEYDTYNNLISITLNNTNLIKLEYDSKHLKEINYSNNHKIEYLYDELDRIITINETDNQINIEYNKTNDDIIIKDNNIKYQNKIINKDNILNEFTIEFNNSNLLITNYSLNDYGNIKRLNMKFNNNLFMLEKKENYLGLVEYIKYNDLEIIYEYNSLYLISNKKYNIFNIEYNYIKNNNQVTNKIESEIFKVSNNVKDTYSYKYYSSGNISEVLKDNKIITKYEYDIYNRLLKEYNYINNIYYQYSYDNIGNIISVNQYNLDNTLIETNNYNYDNLDRLTSIDNNILEYDSLGNVINYFGNIIKWSRKKLKTFNNIKLEYDYLSNRIIKGNKKYYYYKDNLILEEWIIDNNYNYIYYYYDNSGIIGIRYNNIDYYFRKNIFGDIISIYDSFGNLLINYQYDSYGNYTIYDLNNNIVEDDSSIGIINPIRYRGYYYDNEFDLYYLKNRYYSSKLRRFLSIDDTNYLDPNNVFGLNLYNYCLSNPISFIDPKGQNKISIDEIENNIDSIVSCFNEVTYTDIAAKFETAISGFGYEFGTTYSISNAHDNSILSFFSSTDAKDSSFQFGIKINLGFVGFGLSIGTDAIAVSMSVDKYSIELFDGKELGITFAIEGNNIKKYAKFYINRFKLACNTAVAVVAAGVSLAGFPQVGVEIVAAYASSIVIYLPKIDNNVDKLV